MLSDVPKPVLTLRELVLMIPAGCVDQYVWLFEKNQTYIDRWDGVSDGLTRYWYRYDPSERVYVQYTSYIRS